MSPFRLSLTLLLAAFALALAAPVAAQEGAEEELPPVDFAAIEKDRRIVMMRDPMRRRIQRYLASAAEEVDAGDPAEAERLLLKIQESRLNPLESANVFRMLGFVAYGAEKPEAAIGYFQQSLAQEAMVLSVENSMRFAIAQLYMGIGEWAKAVDAFKTWVRYSPNPDPNGFFIMAIAHYQLQEYDRAIERTLEAIERAPKPLEPWLRLLSALYAQKEQYAKAAPVLEELVIRYPSKQYWVQLSLIHAALEDYAVSLTVQQAAHLQGFLTEEKELVRLARSYLYHDLPYPAAKLLEAEIESGRIEKTPENYELLSNSWIAAREYERSLPALRQAAELSEGGKFFVRLGQVHMQREEWGEAAEMLRKAIDKGNLDKPGNTELLLGIAYYNDANLSQARSHFARASRHDEVRAEAERWITHLEREASQSDA